MSKTIFKLYRRKISLLIIALLAGGFISQTTLRAQSALGFNSVGFYGMPDTVANHDGYGVAAYIKIISGLDSLINDSVQLVGYIDTSGAPVQIASPFANITMHTGDSSFFIYPISFDAGFSGQGFRIGNNVIVVWPITTNPNFSSGDTLTATVIVLDGISTGPEPEKGNVRCYPVPASGPLYVTSTNRNLVIKEIQVRNEAGDLVEVTNNPQGGISTEHWAAGVYLLEITFENGEKSHYKVIR